MGKRYKEKLAFTFGVLAVVAASLVLGGPAVAQAFSVDPSDISGSPGDTVTLEISIDTAVTDMMAWKIDITFDTNVLEFSDFDITDTLSAPLTVYGSSEDFGARLEAISISESSTGDPGILVKVILMVKDTAYRDSEIHLGNFTGYIEGADTTDAAFTVTGVDVTVDLTPAETDDVVAGEAVTFTAEILVSGNHRDIESIGDIVFVTSGNGAFGDKSLDGNSNVQVDYTTHTMVEAVTITATETVTGDDNEDTAQVSSVAGLATDLVYVSGDDQTGTVETQLADPFVVKVADDHGNGIMGFDLGFAVVAGGGTLSDTSVTTGSDGNASSFLTLGTVAGVNAARVTGTGLTGSPMTFTASAEPAPLTNLTVAMADVVTAGGGNNVTVTAVDQHGNRVTSFTGTVTLTSSDPNAVLPAPYQYQAEDDGQHTFVSVVLTAAGDQTITASTNGISNFAETTVNPAAASQIVLEADETELVSNEKGNSILTARLLDLFDNPTRTNGKVINLAISDDTYVELDNAAPATILGVATATITTKSGQVANPPQTTSVTATSSGLTDSQPVEFTLVNTLSIRVDSPGDPFVNAEGVHLVTSDSSPSTATFSGINGVSGDYRWALSSCGTIDSTTADTITYTAPETIEGDVCEDTLIVTSASQPDELTDTIKIFVYNPLTVTVPEGNAGIALGYDVFFVIAEGGTGAYTYESSDTGVAEVTEFGVITTVDVGTFTVKISDQVFGDLGMENGFLTETPEIQIINPIVIGSKPANDAMLSAEENQFTVTGGTEEGEVYWEASKGTIDRDGNFTAPEITSATTVTITAYDKTYNKNHLTPVKTTYVLSVYLPLSILTDTDFDPEEPIPPGDEAKFFASGGNGVYTWEVEGPVSVEGATGQIYTFTAPSDGTFSGAYTMTVTDGKDFSDSFAVRVPMAIEPGSFNILEGDTMDLWITGAPEGTTFTVTQHDLGGDEGVWGDFDFGGEPQSPEQPVVFTAPDDIDEAVSLTNTFFASTLDGSLEDAGVDEVTSNLYRIIPIGLFAGTMVDELGEDIPGVTVELTAPAANAQMTNTLDSGMTDADFAFDLPVSGTVYRFRANKAGYVSEDFTSGDLSGETAEDNLIELVLAEGDANIAGTVTQEGQEPSSSLHVRAYYDLEGVPVLAGITPAASPYRFDFATDSSPYTLTASIPGFSATTTVPGPLPAADVDLDLEPTTLADCVDAASGGTTTFAEVPLGAIDTSDGADEACFDMTLEEEAWECGGGEGDVFYEITAVDQIQRPVTFTGDTDMAVTLSFDLAQVPLGGFESGEFVVYQAADLAACTDVEQLNRDRIVATDYVGDGMTGSVTFLVSHLSDFAVGKKGSDDNGGGGLTDNSSDSRCFVATAAYGSPLHEHVKVLRQFRDVYLLPTKAGRALVDAYYRFSPPAAEFIAGHDTLQALARWALVPFVGVSYAMLQAGFSGILLALAPVLLLCLGLWKINRRRMRKAALFAVPVVLACLMAAGSAQAEEKSRFYGALYGVYAVENLDDDETKNKFGSHVKVNFDDSWGFQARAGYIYNEYFSVEGMYEYITPFESDEDSLKDELDVMNFTVNGKLTSPNFDVFVPYVMVGMGAMNAYEDIRYEGNSSKENDWGFGARCGLGFDYYVRPEWTVRAECAYVFGTGDVDNVRYVTVCLGAGYHW